MRPATPAILVCLLLPTDAPGDNLTTQVRQAIEAGKQGDAAQAIKRCRALALENKRHPAAPQAHLAAVVFAGQSLRDPNSTDPSEAQALYLELLAEHVEHWPLSGSAPKARGWLARAKLRFGGLEQVADALALVPAPHPAHGATVDAALDLYQAALESAGADDERIQLLKTARNTLQPVITGRNNRWPAEWSPTQVAVAERLAEWHLRHHPQGMKYAARLLSAVDDLSGLPDRCRLTNRGVFLYCASLPRDGSAIGAGVLLFHGGFPDVEDEQFPGDLADYLELVHANLHKYGDGAEEAAEEVCAIVDLYSFQDDAASDSPWRRPDLERRLTRLRVLTGQIVRGELNEKLRFADRWIELDPDNVDAYEARARLLSTAKGDNYLNRALSAWQTVEDRSEPADERWRNARRNRVQVLRRLGQAEEADKLEALTRLLYPASAP